MQVVVQNRVKALARQVPELLVVSYNKFWVWPEVAVITPDWR